MNILRSATSYEHMLRSLSDRIVTAQRPIRILDAVKWDDAVQADFFARGCSELPKVDRAYYESRPLPFDPAQKRQEFAEIDRDIVRQLGQFSPAGQIMSRMCREYQMVVRMLEARGTPEFHSLSCELYGAAGDAFHAGDPTLADLGVMMSEALTNIDKSLLVESEEKTFTGEEAVEILQKKLNTAFPHSEGKVRVLVSDGIVADAAAGSDYIKIRKEARFNERDLRLLEIHEGWVHVATTLNGLEQPICTFLGKGPPSSTVTQEGLAVLMEVICNASHPDRLRRVTNRIRGIDLAEQGATFVDVFRFFREQGYNEADSYTNAARVFRGSVPDGKPFTKDLTYSKGFVLVYNYVRLAVIKGMLDRIPLLFCGKTRLEDMRPLAQLVEEGLVAPPKYVPPQIADMKSLVAWMCYSSFMNRLSHTRIEMDYSNIL